MHAANFECFEAESYFALVMIRFMPVVIGRKAVDCMHKNISAPIFGHRISIFFQSYNYNLLLLLAKFDWVKALNRLDFEIIKNSRMKLRYL